MGEEPSIKISLELTDYVKTRKYFMDSFKIPTLKQAKRVLGNFADFIYTECDQGLKHFIKAHHWPPYGDMWDSPSDLLLQKFVLKAPPTRKLMEALTAEGAAAVGGAIERKFEKFLKKDKVDALEDQHKHMRKDFEESILHQIKDAEKREKDACLKETKKLKASFAETLMVELKEITQKLQKEYDVLTSAHDSKVKREWEKKIKTAVEKTTKNITKQFLNDLSAQEDIMTMNFMRELGTLQAKRQYEIDKLNAEFKKTMKSARHRLECKNVTNMMYILCMERQKCSAEKEAIQDYYKKEFNEMSQVLANNKTKILRLKNQIQGQIEKLNLRETCILEILKQYQKFIRVALKETPKQADFLLSIEKMLLFEFANALSHIRPCPIINELAKEKSKERIRKQSEYSSISDEETEAAKSKKKHDMFVFNNKLYMKQKFKGFRNLLSQYSELSVKPDEDLWGEDVALLIQKLRECTPTSENTQSRMLNEDLDKRQVLLCREKTIPHKGSNIQFKLSQDSTPLTDLVQVSHTDEPTPKTSIKGYIRSKLATHILSPVDYAKVLNTGAPNILATMSSLELVQQKASTRNVNKTQANEKEDTESIKEIKLGSHAPDIGESMEPHSLSATGKLYQYHESGNLSIGARDSIILRQSSLAKQGVRQFSITTKDSIDVAKDGTTALLRKMSSKLLSTKDSLMLFKNTESQATEEVCILCHQKTNFPKDATLDKDYCCYRCLKKQSVDVLQSPAISRKTDDGKHPQKQITITQHVEVISIESSAVTNVAFKSKLVDKEPEPFYRTELAKMYKPPKRRKDIGYEVEKRILIQHETEKKIALEEQRKRLGGDFQDSILEMIKDAEAVERAACHREIQRLTEEFENQLADQVRGLQEKMEKEFEYFTNNRNEQQRQKLEAKLNSAVEETTKRLTKQLLDEMDRQEKVLDIHLRAEFKKKHIQRLYEVEKQTQEFKNAMQIAKQTMECKNIANMLYILCIERRRCTEEKQFIEDYYMNIKSEMSMRVSIQQEKINNLENELDYQIKQVNLRETCCLEIIKKYQKFINFALRASPTQAQFLLSIQKLMNFELSNPNKEIKRETQQLLFPCETILPLPHSEDAKEPREVEGIFIEDYHDCFNELAIPKTESTTQLPAFHFKNKLYVRQDFRNLISQGIVLTPSHDMWSEDIELLVKTLKASISDIKIKEPSLSEKVDEIKVDEVKLDEVKVDEAKVVKKTAKLKSDKTDATRKLESEYKSIDKLKSSSHYVKLKHVKKAAEVRKVSMEDQPILLNIEKTDNKREPSPLELDIPNYYVEPTCVMDSPCLLATRSSLEIILEKGGIKITSPKQIGSAELEDEFDGEEVSTPSVMTQLVASHSGFMKSTPIAFDMVKSETDRNKAQKTDVGTSPAPVYLDEEHLQIKPLEGEHQEREKKFSLTSEVTIDVREKPSKLILARDSVVFLRESRQALLNPLPFCKRCFKSGYHNHDSFTSTVTTATTASHKEYCCDKCLNRRQSLKLTDGDGGLIKLRKSLDAKSIAVSSDKTMKPTLEARTSEFYPNMLSKLYHSPSKSKINKGKSDTAREKRSYISSTDTEEEPRTREPFVCDNDHTIKRMHSFIKTMSDTPNLIKLFTACQR